MTDREMLDAQERHLVEMLERLQRDHVRLTQPIYDRLAAIRSLRPVPSMQIRTGHLNPEHCAKELQRLKTDKTYALQFLVDIGAVNEKGELKERFGGTAK